MDRRVGPHNCVYLRAPHTLIRPCRGIQQTAVSPCSQSLCGAHTESLRPDEEEGSSDDGEESDNATTTTANSSTASSTAVADSAVSEPPCCEVCLVAQCEGFALVPCGHARFCERCANRVANMGSGCPVCRTDITMVMRVFAW